MTREMNDVQDKESLRNAGAIVADCDAALAEAPITFTSSTAPEEGASTPHENLPVIADSSDTPLPLDLGSLSPEASELVRIQDTGTDRPMGNGHVRIAAVEVLSPATILMPKNVRSLPAKGSFAKALLDSGLRPDATLAASLIHPIVAYPSRDGSTIQGFTNLELAALLRLQNIQTPIVLIEDAKILRFLRSKSGTLLERLLHATNRAERLALAKQLMDVDLWSSLFDEECSEDLVAALIGVSEKTLAKYLKESQLDSLSQEESAEDME